MAFQPPYSSSALTSSKAVERPLTCIPLGKRKKKCRIGNVILKDGLWHIKFHANPKSCGCN